jgi:hypothetical protein
VYTVTLHHIALYCALYTLLHNDIHFTVHYTQRRVLLHYTEQRLCIPVPFISQIFSPNFPATKNFFSSYHRRPYAKKTCTEKFCHSWRKSDFPRPKRGPAGAAINDSLASHPKKSCIENSVAITFISFSPPKTVKTAAAKKLPHPINDKLASQTQKDPLHQKNLRKWGAKSGAYKSRPILLAPLIVRP